MVRDSHQIVLICYEFNIARVCKNKKKAKINWKKEIQGKKRQMKKCIVGVYFKWNMWIRFISILLYYLLYLLSECSVNWIELNEEKKRLILIGFELVNEIVVCVSLFSVKRFAMAAENLIPMIEPAASGAIGFSTIFLLIMFVILTITAIHIYFKTQESYKFAIEMPGPDPIPIFGNALMAIGKTPNGNFSKNQSIWILFIHSIWMCIVKCWFFSNKINLFFGENFYQKLWKSVYVLGTFMEMWQEVF